MEKVALVIGVGRGANIGNAVAHKFVDEGYRVVVADINYATGVVLPDLVSIVEADVTEEEHVAKLMEDIKVEYGRLDAVINCAGVNILGQLETYDLKDWEKTLAVNLTSNFLLLKHYQRVFGEEDYKKVFLPIGSDTGMIPKSSTFAYGASKAGVHHFVRCAARELNKYHGGDKWVISSLAIGMVADTPMDAKTIADLVEQRGITEEEASNMLTANIPVGRGMRASEVADWVHFVASKGEYATGCVLRIDAGQLQG